MTQFNNRNLRVIARQVLKYLSATLTDTALLQMYSEGQLTIGAIDIDWWSDICRQITLSVAAYSAIEVKTPFKSVAEAQTWYLPTVTHKTIDPANKKVRFNIMLIRIPGDSEFLNVQLPKPK